MAVVSLSLSLELKKLSKDDKKFAQTWIEFFSWNQE